MASVLALYCNDRGTFTDVAEAMGVSWGGRAPKVAPNYTHWHRAAPRRNGRHDACTFTDIDHDGALDLNVNGTVTRGRSDPDFLFHDNRSRFDDVASANVEALEADHGVLWFDIDRSGDLDLALVGAQATGMRLVLRNDQDTAAARRAPFVKVVDGKGRATRAGAEVRLYVAGTRTLPGTQPMDTGCGYNAQNDLPVHCGVSRMQRVDVEVIWPARGQRQLVRVRDVQPKRYMGRALIVKTR